ncbi:MAG: ubiquinone biosynthesis regulatory protein kinase UbiB, partial [Betaproteobacteria bacterium]
MNEQMGWRALVRTMKQEAPHWVRTLPQLPRLAHQALAREKSAELAPILSQLAAAQHRQNRLLAIIAALLAVMLVFQYF